MFFLDKKIIPTENLHTKNLRYSDGIHIVPICLLFVENNHF